MLIAASISRIPQNGGRWNRGMFDRMTAVWQRHTRPYNLEAISAPFLLPSYFYLRSYIVWSLDKYQQVIHFFSELRF